MAQDQAAFNAVIEQILNDTIGDRGSFPMMGLTDDDACALAEALRGNTTVTKLHLNWNLIGDRGAAALGKLLRYNDTIIELELVNNDIGDRGAIALAEGIRYHPNLSELRVKDNPFADAGKRAIAEAIILGDLKNITIIPVENLDLRKFCARNFDAARDVLLVNELPDVLEPGRLQTITERWHAIQRAHQGTEVLTIVENKLATMPGPDMSQPDAMSALSVQQGNYRAMDNPTVWWNLDETVAAFNAAGMYLRSQMLLTPEGEPSEILERAIGCGGARHLFRYENWEGASRSELQSVLAVLPEETFIPNRAQLTATIGREERQAAASR